MVVNTKELISPALHRAMKEYSEKNDLAISKDIINSAVSFLKNHTALSSSEIDKVIENAISSIHKKEKVHSNYEGDKEVNPKDFGKEVVLVCTQNGIRIKRVPNDIEAEVKDSFEGIDQDVLDKTYVILDMQPDLDQEDRGRVVLQSVLDSLNDKDSFTGDIDYEVFGQKVNENLKKVRQEKEKSMAVDKLMDMFVNENDYYGESIADAYSYYADKYNLQDDDFADYFDRLFLEHWNIPMDQNDSYEGGHDYLFKKLRAKVQQAKKNIQQKHAVKKQKRSVKRAARKEKRKERGSVIGNILTGGALGAAKKAKAKAREMVAAKKARKKAKRDAAAAMNAQKTEVLNQQNAPAANVTNTGIGLIPDAAALPQPPASSSGGGGGGGEGPQDSGGGYSQSEDEGEEGEEISEEEGTEDLEQEDGEEQPEEEPEMTDEEYAKSQINKGIREEQAEWYPDNEDDEEIASFFGLKKKVKKVVEKEPLEEMFSDKFIGDSMDTDSSKTILIVIVLVAVAVIVYFKFIKK